MKVNSGRPDPDRGFLPTVGEAAAAHGVTPDLVVSCIPAAATADALREAAAVGARAALVCAGGFAEAGDDGALHQKALTEVVRDTGIRVLGPNTSGFLAPHRRLTASFVPGASDLEPGPVAVVAASGGVNHALAFALAEAGVGLRLGVGLGNSLDVTQGDVLRHLAEDDGVRAVALHVETAAEGRRLTEAVHRLTDRVPVVALVVGRSDIGDFARSHTGALATSWRVTGTALRQAGAVLVDDERDLVGAVTALSRVRLPANPRPGIGLVTAQAGPGLLLTDDLRSHGIQVPPLVDRTVKELRELLPALTYLNNPVDTGRPSPALTQVVERVSEDPGIDVTAVYGLLEPTAVDLPAALTAARTATPSSPSSADPWSRRGAPAVNWAKPAFPARPRRPPDRRWCARSWRTRLPAPDGRPSSPPPTLPPCPRRARSTSTPPRTSSRTWASVRPYAGSAPTPSRRTRLSTSSAGRSS